MRQFFSQPIKTNKKRMKNMPECQGTITTRSLKDYSYHQNYYNLICID